MNISDNRFNDWKVVITNPSGRVAAIGPSGAVAIAKGTGEVVTILAPIEVAFIIEALREINPPTLNECLKQKAAIL